VHSHEPDNKVKKLSLYILEEIVCVFTEETVDSNSGCTTFGAPCTKVSIFNAVFYN
jgi:hypothetical protein